MHNPQDFDWCIPPDVLAGIKEEQSSDSSILSSPTSSTTNLPAPSSLCQRTTSLASPKRVRPYPTVPRKRFDISPVMATTPAYGSYVRSGSDGSSSEGESLPYDSYAVPSMQAHQYDDGRTRPTSSPSSLTGVFGDQHQLQGWSVSHGPPLPANSTFPGVAGGNVYSTPGFHSSSPPQSRTPQSPYVGYPPAATLAGTEIIQADIPPSYPSPLSSTSPLEEILSLRRKVQQLQQRFAQDQQRIASLEAQLRNSPPRGTGGPIPVPSPGFHQAWKARTDARIRQFCSLNRAGNALCAWHDSRRERRKYPARMAPPGELNCGCTFEEALFEESLARHGVGSYLPGDSVRMDPSLRNPLLRLLQERYGYRDGDFERDPRTGDWVPGEGPTKWEQQIQGGITNPRRPRPIDDRR